LKTLKKKKLTSLIAGVLCFMFLPIHGEISAKERPTFLFGEDEALSDTGEFFDAIEKSSEIKNDEFLQTPLSRLDYVLIKLEEELNSEKEYLTSKIKAYFERIDDHYSPPYAEFSASYSEKIGRIELGAHFYALGKPRKSMKSFCNEIIEDLQVMFPQKPEGLMMYNRSLGILNRKKFKFYKIPVGVITRNHSLAVRLESKHGGNQKYGHKYFLQCYKLDHESPIKYQKLSLD
jgi:hypothetical protein